MYFIDYNLRLYRLHRAARTRFIRRVWMPMYVRKAMSINSKATSAIVVVFVFAAAVLTLLGHVTRIQ